METSVRQHIADHPILTFVAITFAYSWTVVLGIYLFVDSPGIFHEIPFAWGPLIGGAVTLKLRGEDIRDWLGHVRNWRVGWHWYVLALGISVLTAASQQLLALLLGADVAFTDQSLLLPLVGFLLTLFIAGSLEEFGWRGFAQSRLQQRHNAVATNVFIGIVWASWHLPLFFLLEHAYDPAGLAPYYLMSIGQSIVYGWMYNSTNGGLFVVMVAHAGSNMPSFLTITGETPALVEALPTSGLTYLIISLLVILYAGSATLNQRGRLPRIPGRRTDGEVPPA